jgi:hypothetical protein
MRDISHLGPKCPACNHYGGQWIDGHHLCTVYDGPQCKQPGCTSGTVFVTVAAPGTGSGWTCQNGHYTGTCRILTLNDVI